MKAGQSLHRSDMGSSAASLRAAHRRICFVTGTRAEFGLMRTVLEAIRGHPQLQLQLIATGMHLDPRHGRSIDAMRREGWKIDAIVPWPASADPTSLAQHTGHAMALLGAALHRLRSEIVMVVGDRVEAFAAASAAHVSQRIVAHIHGGDRAPGQIDDSLRHAITKLSHIHFPATPSSARRLIRLGEDRANIHCVGSPGIDGIAAQASSAESISRTFPKLSLHQFALIVLHPVDTDADIEQARAEAILAAVWKAGISQTVIVYPNNDPASAGIIRAWRGQRHRITYLLKDLPRGTFVGLMRDSAVLVGNSSSGIIEAASFGTPVLDIGPRQQGRERCKNVTSVAYDNASIESAARRIWNRGHPRRWRGRNLYGGLGTAQQIAAILAAQVIEPTFCRKVISY